MRRLAPFVSLLLVLAPLGCGDDVNEDSLLGAAQKAAEALRQAADAMEQAGSNLAATNESIADGDEWSGEQLQDALPTSLVGLERTSSRRESTGAAGIRISQAVATYGADDRTLEVQLMSGGGLMAGPAMAFTLVDFDRADDNGYERTITRNGLKGMQKWEDTGSRQRATLTLLVNRNLLVQLESSGLTMDEVERAFDALNLR